MIRAVRNACNLVACARTFVHLENLYSRDHTTLKLATRFWADVRLVFRNSSKPLRESTRVSCRSKTNGFRDATFQRTYSSGRFAPPSHARSPALSRGSICHRRWLASRTGAGCTSHDRSWEEEALQDVMLSQQQDFLVSLKDERGISIHDQSLRTASPLHSFAPNHPTPRFDWRRRALSRAPSRSHGKDAQTHVKRVVPQHREIEPGGRFYHEVKAYESRWVLFPVFEVITKFLSIQISTLAGGRTSRRREGNA